MRNATCQIAIDNNTMPTTATHTTPMMTPVLESFSSSTTEFGFPVASSKVVIVAALDGVLALSELFKPIDDADADVDVEVDVDVVSLGSDFVSVDVV